jgi:hypothetical protein
MNLISRIGDLATAQSNGTLDALTLGPGLAQIFAVLVKASNEAGVTLDEAAQQNLEKTFDRWPIDRTPHGLFDQDYDVEERLPRNRVMRGSW